MENVLHLRRATVKRTSCQHDNASKYRYLKAWLDWSQPSNIFTGQSKGSTEDAHLVSGSADDRREDGHGCIVSSKSGFARV